MMRLVATQNSAKPSKAKSVTLPSFGPTLRLTDPKVLDFDLETIAAGFADPDWVPQKITCAAWSWVGSGKVESRICGPLGIYGKPELRREMLEPMLEEIAK